MIRDQLREDASAGIPIFSGIEAADQSSRSVEIEMGLQTDILASIPQSTRLRGYGPFSNSLTYFVLWPLYLVGMQDLTTEQCREWVIQRLRSIAEEVGIQQAAMLAGHVLRRKYLDPFDKNEPRLRRGEERLRRLKG